MSSDPDRHVAGELGEGSGLRDNLDPELTKSDEVLEDVVKDDKPDTPAKPLILIGSRANGQIKVRCHRCGTAKNEEDKGIFMQINEYIAWLHNEECHSLWIDQYGTTSYKSGAIINQYGKEI